jgi:hypothetical protein
MSPDLKRREAFLKFVIVVAITLSAGPEIFAAMEMRILLELLGVTLFTTAFIAGARLILLSISDNLRRYLLPAPAAFIAVAFADAWLGVAAACMTSIHSLWQLF